MSVFVCVPSKRPPAEVEKWAQAWRDMGYRVRVQRDEHGPTPQLYDADSYQRPYRGYSEAVNFLIRYTMRAEPDASWFVIGGDDVYPDTTKRADEIAAECEAYFRRVSTAPQTGEVCQHSSLIRELDFFQTFGVMQPTGDRWGDSEQMRDRYGADRGAYIDRIAGSAWIGREFALRAYGGNGPLWHEYTHMFPDEELQCVAEKLGVFWQRRDLMQMHKHWARGDNRTREDIPEFLREANSPEHWQRFQKLFNDRKAAGFPGHEVK